MADLNLCIYLIGFVERDINPCLRPVKIGITNNLKKRLDTFQTASPWELEVIGAQYRTDADMMEKWLHRHFADCHVRGEWFMPPPGVDVREWASFG